MLFKVQLIVRTIYYAPAGDTLAIPSGVQIFAARMAILYKFLKLCRI